MNSYVHALNRASTFKVGLFVRYAFYLKFGYIHIYRHTHTPMTLYLFTPKKKMTLYLQQNNNLCQKNKNKKLNFIHHII